jgi:cyclase
MLAKRIIPCLDVMEDKVVKGVQFNHHQVVGDILELAQNYSDAGADELVFYDITASTRPQGIAPEWVEAIAKVISIPFCVAGGIRTLSQAQALLYAGADKVSINSPALERPELIGELAATFGAQAVVVGIDSFWDKNQQQYRVKQYTGQADKAQFTQWSTEQWIREVQRQGAGEIVLNTMNQDGMRQGYDLVQLANMRKFCKVPLIASGGAGTLEHFYEVFTKTQVEGALAASVFHKGLIDITDLKHFLSEQGLEVRS